MDAKMNPMQAIALRYVHDAGAGESLNVGVVLLCLDRRYLAARFLPSWTRITGAFRDVDPVHLRRFCAAIEKLCMEWSDRPGDLLDRDVVALVRRVLPPTDQGIVLTPVISGMTSNPERSLAELFERYVGRHAEGVERVARDDEDVWRSVSSRIAPELLARMRPHVLIDPAHPSLRLEFRHAWKNAAWHAAQPLSFDLADADQILRKASTWIGNIHAMQPERHGTEVHIVVGLPAKDRPHVVRDAAKEAFHLLVERVKTTAEVVSEEQDAQRLADQIAQDLAAHPDGE